MQTDALGAMGAMALLNKQTLPTQEALSPSSGTNLPQTQAPQPLGEYDARIAQEKAYAKLMDNQFNKQCQTCKNRKYQDGSNDPGVSFKSAQHIDPASSASVVMSHEMEHVRREQNKATQEGGKVLSQSVRLHGAFCPDCGRYYIAGGVTQTVVRHAQKSKSETPQAQGLNTNA